VTNTGKHYLAEQPLGVVVDLQGQQAQVIRPDGAANNLLPGDLIYAFDQLLTDAKTKMTVYFANGSYLHLASNSHTAIDAALFDFKETVASPMQAPSLLPEKTTLH
jgi:hypothetical protein